MTRPGATVRGARQVFARYQLNRRVRQLSSEVKRKKKSNEQEISDIQTSPIPTVSTKQSTNSNSREKTKIVVAIRKSNRRNIVASKKITDFYQVVGGPNKGSGPTNENNNDDDDVVVIQELPPIPLRNHPIHNID